MSISVNPDARPRLGNLAIRQLANKLLEASGAMPRSGEELVDLSKILSHLDFSYFEFDPRTAPDSMSNIKGAVIHEDKKVFLNSDLTPQEKNFSLAHEIGHIVLHNKGDKIDFLHHSLDEVPVDEIEANVFAYELLMPIYFFVMKSKSDITTEELAKFYCVTEKRVKKRISFEKRLNETLESKLVPKD